MMMMMTTTTTMMAFLRVGLSYIRSYTRPSPEAALRVSAVTHDVRSEL